MKLIPPIVYGRLQKNGITTRIDIAGKWENVLLVRSQGYGIENTSPPMLPFYQSLGMVAHNGEDYVTFDGDPILATHDGVVLKAIFSPTGGNWVWIWNKEEQYITIYMHNKSLAVAQGDQVKQGQVIAYSDSTGSSTGTHCHLGLYLTDIMGNIINRNNGYDGAIDSTPYLINAEQMTITKEEKDALYRLTFYREPDPASDGYVGKELSFVLDEFEKSQEFINQKALINAARKV